MGKNDFSSFRASGGGAKTSIRTIYEIDINVDGDLIFIDISGDGFLYNMVRIIVGTLVHMAIKKIDPSIMLDILQLF